MFIPFVPVVPNTTVINNNIVYSDTVLPLKDSGNNLKVTSISDVGEYSLERCLKTIFESNPNVVFNTIQYSKNDKKVYFYTDSEISIKAWTDSTVLKYKPVTSSSEILEEVKRVLLSEKNKDENCISLLDVAQLMKNKNNKYNNMKDLYESHLERVIKDKYGSSEIIVHDFDYDKNELNIGFKYLIFSDNYDDIYFAKENGDLFIKKSETYKGSEILAVAGDILSEMYDEFMEYKDFERQYHYSFKAVNSNFLINVNMHGVSIENDLYKSKDTFELHSYSYNDDWEYNCNSYTVLSTLKGKERDIFSRIFIDISDCPEWSQPILYEFRQNQLAEEQRIEEEQKNREMKRQKRIELTRKLFPFLNK